jgi:sialate O-acetylesterase
MAVTMDIGNLTDIHPKNKQEVGRRLALWALANDYDRDIVFSGPIYREGSFDHGKARLRFDHTGSGLATRDGRPPSDSPLAGSDQVFHPAEIEIVGDQLIVSSDKVPEPKAVRYAFTSEAMPNLINKEGLPASPFRTDDW